MGRSLHDIGWEVEDPGVARGIVGVTYIPPRMVLLRDVKKEGVATVAIPGYNPPPNAPSGLYGWVSGAFTRYGSFIGRELTISFDVPDLDGGARPAGVAVGIASDALVPTTWPQRGTETEWKFIHYRYGYKHLSYGLVFTADELRVVYDGGNVVATFPYADIRAARELDSTTDQVYCLISDEDQAGNQTLRWVVNGISVFFGPFSIPLSSQYVLDATLYAPYDSVQNPVFTEGPWDPQLTFPDEGLLTAIMPGLGMTSSWSTSLVGDLPGLWGVFSQDEYSDIAVSLRSLGMTCSDRDVLIAQMAPIGMVAAEPAIYATSTVSFWPLQMAAVMTDGAGDPGVRYSVMAPFMPRISANASMASHMSGNMDLHALSMRASSEALYSELAAATPTLAMIAYGGDMTNFVDVTEFVFARQVLLDNWVIHLVFSESVSGEASVTLVVVQPENCVEHVTSSDTNDLTVGILDGLIEQIGAPDKLKMFVLNLADGSDATQGDAWAVNTHTSASSRYDRFSFNSFATVLGQSFGAKRGGLHLLNGANDAGAAITSGVALGKRSFGTSALKRLDAVYIGVSSAGNMFLKVGDGATSYTYTARAAGANLRTQRFDIGKGLRANYLTFEITNESDRFELDTVEFNILASARRIQ